MAATDNPAGRLVTLLDEARKHQEMARTREVWATVFGVDPTDTANLLYMYAQLIQLVKTAKDEISELEHIDQEIYQRPFVKLERTFSKVSLEGRWQATRNELDEATMVALRFCADTLSRERGEGEVDSDTLAELSTEVSSLLEKVLASEVPDELKVVLSEGLEVVRRALLEYRLRGADGLRRALETVIGSLIRHSAEVKKNQGKKTVREYLEFLARLNDVVALSLKTKQLLAPVVNYFIGSGDN